MARKEETRLINPFLVVGALLVIAVGLGAGLWLALKEGPLEKPALPVEVVEESDKQAPPPKQAPSAPRPAPAEVMEETREALAAVSGVVYLGAEETRAAGVTVRAFSNGKAVPAHEVRTDDLGQFQIPEIQPGNWLFRAGGEGLAAVHAKSYDDGREIKPGESQGDVALRVVPSATLEGKVLNAIGKELPGATVHVIRGANSAGEEVQGPPSPPFPRIGLFESPPPPSKTRTGAKGEFALHDLEAGTYDLVAYASGYARQMIREVRTGASDAVFRLEPEVRLFGTVKLSSTGAILPGATITVQIPLKEGPFLSGTLLAGPTGTYEVRNLPRRFEARLQAMIDRADSCPYRLAPIGGLSQIRQDLLIMDNRKITGHVVHAFDRSPLADVEVDLKNQGRERSAGRSAADGVFTVQTSFSSNDLIFRKPGGFEGNDASANFMDDSPELDIGEVELVQGVRVSGRVIDAKSKGGIGGALVRAFRVDQTVPDWERLPSQTTSGAGDFTFDFIPPGAYYIAAQAYGYREGFYGEPKGATEGLHPQIQIPPDRNFQGLQIALTASALATLSGLVVDTTGTPIAGAQVTLRSIENPKEEKTLSGATDQSGGFEWTSVPVGSYSLSAEQADYYPGGLASVSVLPNLKDQQVKVVLEPKSELTISGRVFDEEENPLPNASVGAIAGRMEYLFAVGFLSEEGLLNLNPSGRRGAGPLLQQIKTGNVAEARSGGDGTYSLEGLRPGKYTVVAEMKGAFDLRYDVDAGASGVDFVLRERGGAISGVVYQVDGKTPCTKFTVQVMGPPGGFYSSRQVLSEDGTFEITELGDGVYTLHVRAEGQGEASLFSLEVVDGAGPTDIKVVLNGGGSIVGRALGPKGQPVPRAVAKVGRVECTLLPDGTFAFLGLPQDRYALVVRHKDYAPIVVPSIPVSAGGRADVGTLTFGNGGTISGRVRYSSGEGCGNRLLRAEPAISEFLADLLETPSTRTDGQGYFSFPRMAQGEYRLSVRSEPGSLLGFSSQSKTVAVHDGQTSQVDFVLDEGVRVQGQVTVQGRPLARSTFVLYPRGGSSRGAAEEFVTVTDAAGNYLFEGVPAGNYEAVAAEFSPEDSRSASVTIPDQPVFEQNFSF
ncbi:MAG: hypothetical protein GHCLOJNM_00390 [bacterium]|nr:hypothetical protein [bacterium]